jgi:FtsP/CotA-like multicopper oxidase with cupredoxin domain
LRMDFRDPAIVGTFPYHCHLLDHEDAGMMGVVRVEPARGH